jgi:hypothetical protein
VLSCRYARKKKPKSSTLPEAEDWGDSDEDPEADGSSSSSSKRPPHQRKPVTSSSSSGSKPPASNSSSSGLGADAPSGSYSPEVLTSLQVVDPSMINYDLIESLLVHIVAVQQQQGPTGLLKVGGPDQNRQRYSTAQHSTL